MIACYNGHTDIVKVLLQCDLGVNVNLQYEDGDTALTIATRSGHAQVVRLLVHHAKQLGELAPDDSRAALAIALKAKRPDLAKLLTPTPIAEQAAEAQRAHRADKHRQHQEAQQLARKEREALEAEQLRIKTMVEEEKQRMAMEKEAQVQTKLQSEEARRAQRNNKKKQGKAKRKGSKPARGSESPSSDDSLSPVVHRVQAPDKPPKHEQLTLQESDELDREEKSALESIEAAVEAGRLGTRAAKAKRKEVRRTASDSRNGLSSFALAVERLVKLNAAIFDGLMGPPEMPPPSYEEAMRDASPPAYCVGLPDRVFAANMCSCV